MNRLGQDSNVAADRMKAMAHCIPMRPTPPPSANL
jgi:hypothetical protein